MSVPSRKARDLNEAAKKLLRKWKMEHNDEWVWFIRRYKIRHAHLGLKTFAPTSIRTGDAFAAMKIMGRLGVEHQKILDQSVRMSNSYHEAHEYYAAAPAVAPQPVPEPQPVPQLSATDPEPETGNCAKHIGYGSGERKEMSLLMATLVDAGYMVSLKKYPTTGNYTLGFWAE